MTFLDQLQQYSSLLLFALALLLIYVFNKLVLYLFNRSTEHVDVPADLRNALAILLRFLMGLLVIYAAVNLLNITDSTVLGLSVFLGSIISFASIYTIQNFISGLYILFTEPFSVNDLVRIGSSEGVVVEVSLNYTRIVDFDGMVQSIPNKKILGSAIVNYDQRVEYTEESDNLLELIKGQFDDTEVTKYTFVWGAPLIDLGTIKNRLDKVCEDYTEVFGYRPSYMPYTINHRFEFSFVLSADDPMLILRHKTDFLDSVALQFH